MGRGSNLREEYCQTRRSRIIIPVQRLVARLPFQGPGTEGEDRDREDPGPAAGEGPGTGGIRLHRHVLDSLRDTARRVPDKLAFSDGTSGLTFRELGRLAASAGTYLCRNGIRRQPVAVFMRKSPAEVAAFFGVIAGGCFYVPLDEEMPASRIQLILDTIRSPLVICDRDTIGKAASFELGDGRAVLFDEAVSTEPDVPALEEIYRRSLDIDPVYIVFTSGSTGIPKGVAACHRSVLDYVEQLSEVLEFSGDTVFGNQTPLYFDACLKEIIPVLKFGCTAYLIPREYFSQPVRLIGYLNEHRINTICWVVSALTMVSAFDAFSEDIPRYLRTVAFGSEVFPAKQFNIWRKALPEAKFYNLYGPTETTGMCCWYRADRDFAEDEAIPIGRPFDNREILLLKEDGSPAGPGEEGEICIRGTAVTLGYYNDPERTARSFVQNPLNSAWPERIYRTGDMARYNEDGDLVFVSRKDWQIKHMGHRVELGEIEITAGMVSGVRMAACIYDQERGKIVLYYVGDIQERELSAALRQKLPRYMLPGRTLRIPSLPRTANGKIDRNALKVQWQEKDRTPVRERKH